MMLGFLLARAGVDVLVLEKHADFFRDFRGDTIHPSTFELMHELGLLDAFLKVPHQELPRFGGRVGDTTIVLADFTRLPTVCKFIGLMPQWDFLNFLADQARRYPTFRLWTDADVTDLLFEGDVVSGVRGIRRADGGTPFAVRADLIVGADGRRSVVRSKAGLEVREIGAPIDVLWMRFSRRPDDPEPTLGRVNAGKMLATLNRGDYWQCAYVIRKDGLADVQERGLAALRDDVAALAPFLADRVGELRDWDDVKLLTVVVDRLRRWYRRGLLCIGDAAHAMSPIGGVGVNLAVQDAVAAANAAAPYLARGSPVPLAALRGLQRRRIFPAAVTQRMQVFIAERILSRFLDRTDTLSLPRAVRFAARVLPLHRVLGYVVGVGIRPERIRTASIAAVPYTPTKAEAVPPGTPYR